MRVTFKREQLFLLFPSYSNFLKSVMKTYSSLDTIADDKKFLLTRAQYRCPERLFQSLAITDTDVHSQTLDLAWEPPRRS